MRDQEETSHQRANFADSVYQQPPSGQEPGIPDPDPQLNKESV